MSANPSQPCAVPAPPKQPFWTRRRFWSLVAALGGGLPTTGTVVAAGVALLAINPIAGAAMLAGAALGLAGTCGLAWFGFKATAPMQWTADDQRPRDGGGKLIAPEV
jgi:hypothetical protein